MSVNERGIRIIYPSIFPLHLVTKSHMYGMVLTVVQGKWRTYGIDFWRPLSPFLDLVNSNLLLSRGLHFGFGSTFSKRDLRNSWANLPYANTHTHMRDYYGLVVGRR